MVGVNNYQYITYQNRGYVDISSRSQAKITVTGSSHVSKAKLVRATHTDGMACNEVNCTIIKLLHLFSLNFTKSVFAISEYLLV